MVIDGGGEVSVPSIEIGVGAGGICAKELVGFANSRAKRLVVTAIQTRKHEFATVPVSRVKLIEFIVVWGSIIFAGSTGLKLSSKSEN